MNKKKFNLILGFVAVLIIGVGLISFFITQKDFLEKGIITSGEIISIKKEYITIPYGAWKEKKYTDLIGVVGFINKSGVYQTGSILLGQVEGHKKTSKANELSGYDFGTKIEIKYIPKTGMIIKGGNYNEQVYKKIIAWILGFIFILLLLFFGKRINGWGGKSPLLVGINRLLEKIKKILNTSL